MEDVWLLRNDKKREDVWLLRNDKREGWDFQLGWDGSGVGFQISVGDFLNIDQI